MKKFPKKKKIALKQNINNKTDLLHFTINENDPTRSDHVLEDQYI